MITLEDDRLVFRFPEIHSDAQCAIEFQRTLRIPDDGLDYPLPPGIGRFPLSHLDDFAQRVPPTWLRRGGVLMPMHQAEAMWINFDCGAYPFAVKVAAGKDLRSDGRELDQPPQHRPAGLRGAAGAAVARRVLRSQRRRPSVRGDAAGPGATRWKSKLTGAAEHGGLQLIAYPMKAERYEDLLTDHVASAPLDDGVAYSPV